MDDSIRTEVLDIAPIELAKKQELTMQDVRKFLDNYLKELIPNRENKRDPNTGELLLVPKSKYYTYRNDEREIYIEAIRRRINDIDFSLELPEEGKLGDAIRKLANIASFIEKDDIPAFINWYSKVVLDIKNTCEIGSVDREVQNGMHLIIDSTVKGLGKSTFQRKFINDAKKLGIPVEDEATLPLGGFYNHVEESENLLVGYQEIGDQKIDRDTWKNIGRRELYEYCEKGKMPIKLPARAITMTTTNGCAPKEDRTRLVVNCLEMGWQQRSQYMQFEFPEDTNLFSISKSKISRISISSELGRQIDKEICELSPSQSLISQILKAPGIADLQNVLEELKELGADLSYSLDWISVNGLSRLYKKYTMQEMRKPGQISECLQRLYAFGILKQKQQKTQYQHQYNLGDIVETVLGLDTDIRPKSVEEKFQEALDEWKKWIDIADQIDKEEEMNFQQLLTETKAKMTNLFTETGEILSDNHEFLEENTQKIPDNTNKSQQFILLNEPLENMPEPDHPRKDINRKGNNFIFEVDDLPIDKQKEMIADFAEEHKENILWLCSSGNKSIHCAVHTNCNTNESSIRKEVQQYFNKKYFQGHLDMSTYNAGRICRNPNGYRIKDGVAKLQQAYLINENAKPLDVSDIVARIKAKQEEEAKKLAEERAKRKQGHLYSSNEKHPLTVEYLQTRRNSPRRDAAIRMLEGTAQWSEMCSACMYLLDTGFTREDIESKLWEDEWLEGALNKAESNISKS